ncbi:MAG: aminopeptidase [Candidatus Lernaella stagnicola]|nr:aminopeptidase [Candidatus Lernaella stagnicola]
MYDSRVADLAKVFVDYSTRVKKGDVVLIHAFGAPTIPFVKEVHKRCIQKGAKYVEIEMEFDDIRRDFFNLGSKEQVGYFPQHKMDFMKHVDVYIGIRALENDMVLANANHQNMRLWQTMMKPILDRRVEHTRWCITRWPVNAMAQNAKMSLEEFTDFFFRCTVYDYAALKKRQQKLVRLMVKTDQVHITASDTDLRFSIKGLPAINCAGEMNIPDGEVFTAPVRDSVEGHVTYNTPSIYMGKEFNGVRLDFEKGQIVSADCSSGDPKNLNEIFDTDPGARYVGEFAIGTNTGITQPMRNILFDEKIYGSFHFTPGMAYGECNNGNQSAIHWDLVKIMTGDGEIRFDGKVIMKDGVFVHPQLLDLNPPGTKLPKGFAVKKPATKAKKVAKKTAKKKK